jgi:hypothetical protein
MADRQAQRQDQRLPHPDGRDQAAAATGHAPTSTDNEQAGK